MSKYSQPTCPVCHTESFGPAIHIYTSAEAAAHFCPPSRDFGRYVRLQRCIERLWSGANAAVHLCPACGFGFGWPYVGGDEEFYSIMHEMAGYPTWRWEFDFTVGSVLPGLAEGPVLDIGAGFGGFLRRLDKRWTRCATEGSETTRRILRDAEIRCYTDLSEAVREAGGTFAVVTMFQVLEHLSNFENILAGCNALLRPGGVLVVAVPDADSTWAQERLTGFPDMIPNHINKWTPHALEIAMRRAGFNAEPVRHEPGSWRFVTYRALLRVKAKSSRDPSSCGAMAYRLRMRWLRIPILAGLAGMELIRCTGRLHEMYHGRSIVMVAGKSMS